LKRLMFFLLLFGALQAGEYTKIPAWYYKIGHLSAQKKAFFEILRPLVEKENQKILQERRFVEEFFAALPVNPVPEDAALERLAAIAKKYRIKELFDKEAYLRKIDTVPVALVLAQAALESGWGKSRFAREANNLFGEWTWGKKGLVPKHRAPGKRHKIRIFKTLGDSIASYMLNLNRHRAYREFRLARRMAKKRGRPFGGIEAAMTMKRYSQIGSRYTRLVASIIRKNGLHLD